GFGVSGSRIEPKFHIRASCSEGILGRSRILIRGSFVKLTF
ncbi:unnamed protein product, partial [Linum tenue]